MPAGVSNETARLWRRNLAALVAAVFIGFALTVSFLAPRRWPDFPGRHGLSVFVIACIALFVAMLAAVVIFGGESEAAGGAFAHEGNATGRTIDVSESEYKISLPTLGTLGGGEYTFRVRNDGQIPHDLVIQGPNAVGPSRTKLIQPGGSATLTVSLATGRYTLYCSVDDHRKLGMVARIAVG